MALKKLPVMKSKLLIMCKKIDVCAVAAAKHKII